MQIRWSGMDFPETVMSCQTICGGAGECFTMMLANFESHFGCFSTPGVCKLTFKYSWIVHKTSPFWQFDTRQTDFSTVIGHETQLQPKTGVVTHGKVSDTNRLNKESAHLNRILFIMPSCQGHAFHVAGLFLGESSGYWWFPPPPTNGQWCGSLMFRLMSAWQKLLKKQSRGGWTEMPWWSVAWFNGSISNIFI